MSHRFLFALGLLALASGCSSSGGSQASSSSTSANGAGGSSTSASAANGTGSGTGTPATGTGAGGGGADPCANSFFCDDFEAYPLGNPPGGKWGNNANGGTVAVDTEHAKSGTHAVKASAAAGGYRSVMISLTDASLLPVTGNVIYGRMMFYLDSSPTTNVHWTFISGSGPTGQGYSSVYRYGGQTPLTDGMGAFIGNQLMANYDTPDSYQSPPVGPSSDCWLHATTEVVPVGTWSCAEWEFDGPNNTMHFWLDTNPLPDLTMNGTGQGCVHQGASYTWLAPQFDRIDLGFESYQTDEARTIWIDDVALGTQRLGCPQ